MSREPGLWTAFESSSASIIQQLTNWTIYSKPTLGLNAFMSA